MAIFQRVLELYESYFTVSFNSFIFSIFLALVLILVGIFLGKVVAFILKKVFSKLDVEKNIRPSFLKLIIVVIKWSIYVVFIDFALIQLPIPGLTQIITKALVVIPALTGSLVLIGIGFGIAIYLREVVEDSEVTEWKMLSLYLFYFIIYVFGVYALKLALISLDGFVSNMIILILTGIIGLTMAYNAIKKEVHHNK